MSDDRPEMEGWSVSPWPALAAMLAIIVILALALTLGEHRYRATIGQERHRPIHRFPAPRLDGFDDPARPTPPPSRQAAPLSDAALGAAAASGHAMLQDPRP